jgi:ParB family chromosome partitioning protein
VAHDAASSNALAEIVQTLTEARNEGHLIQRLPLHLIDAERLVRDRIAADPDEMAVLKTASASAISRLRSKSWRSRMAAMV